MTTATAEKTDIPAMMAEIGRRARAAQAGLAMAPRAAKDKALTEAAASLRRRRNHILSENAKDMAFGEEKGLSKAMLDRLLLNDERV
ncbi:MAG: gamma-glutamyl-phosphate reductase, partial [Rhodospirillales bacterium CG15_BIG_FIL_POST_REV_8_21_14_020_66_15]